MLQWSVIPRLVDGNYTVFGNKDVHAPKPHISRIISGPNEETALQVQAKLHVLQLLDNMIVKEALCRSVMRCLATGRCQ